MRTSNQAEIDALLTRVAEEPNISPYLTEAARRAISTTEAEHMAATAEKAQRAFLSVMQTASEERTTAALLSRARTYSHHLWENENLYEDEYNAKIVAFCTTLMDGNPVAGMLLASAAVFGGSKYV